MLTDSNISMQLRNGFWRRWSECGITEAFRSTARCVRCWCRIVQTSSGTCPGGILHTLHCVLCLEGPFDLQKVCLLLMDFVTRKQAEFNYWVSNWSLYAFASDNAAWCTSTSRIPGTISTADRIWKIWGPDLVFFTIPSRVC